MKTNCNSDEFYTRMSLEGVEGQQSREVKQLPLSNCNTYQEVINFDDFEQEVANQGKTIDNTQKFKLEEIAYTFRDFIQEKPNMEQDNNFKLTEAIILLVGREIQNSMDFISITDERKNPNEPSVLLDKKNHMDRFAEKLGKEKVSKELIEMLRNDIFNKIQNLTPNQMFSILMAFFLSDLIVRQYQTIFVDDYENGYRYSTTVVEIKPDKLGKINFQYIEKNKETISKLFKIQSDKLGNLTYEIIIGHSGEIRIVKSYFVFEAVIHNNFGDEKILLAIIYTKITYFLSSNHKTIEDEFRWILHEQKYNLIKQNVPTPWFINCLSINKELKEVTDVENTKFNITNLQANMSEKEALIEKTALTLQQNNSNLSTREIKEQEQQNEMNKRTLSKWQAEMPGLEAEHQEAKNTEDANTGIGNKVLSKIKQNPGKTMLGIGGLTAAGVLAWLGGKRTKKPKRMLKKKATQRRPKIVPKNTEK